MATAVVGWGSIFFSAWSKPCKLDAIYHRFEVKSFSTTKKYDKNSFFLMISDERGALSRHLNFLILFWGNTSHRQSSWATLQTLHGQHFIPNNLNHTKIAQNVRSADPKSHPAPT